VADHLADKLCATIGTHVQRGRAVSSSRVKDLVDIAIIATTLSTGSEALRIAVVTNAALRGLDLPRTFRRAGPGRLGRTPPPYPRGTPGPRPGLRHSCAPRQ